MAERRCGNHSWTPLFDHQPALGIGEPGAIAIDPNNTNTIYVGTSGRVGSAEPDTILQPSAGLFKSTDGGTSWIALGSGFPAGNTGNANQFALPVPVDQRHHRRSRQQQRPLSGVELRRVRFVRRRPELDTGRRHRRNDTRSLALDLSTPASARILHAGVSGTGVFRSTNGGASFSQVLSAATPAVAAALGAGSFGRVVVALAPPASPPNVNGVQVLYVTMSGGGGAPDPLGVFLSTDHGGTWTKQTATGISGTTYGGYALDMAVDPASPGNGTNDTLYFGCQNQFTSTNSGGNFTPLSVGHVDTHTWTLVPGTGGAGTTIYCGSDGGIDFSTNGGASWTSRNGGGLQTGLFYNIAVKPDATASVTVGALQDNELETTAGGPVGLAWNATYGGDGWDVAYDGGTPPALYGTSGGPATVVSVSNDDGLTYPTVVTPPWTSADTGGFFLTQIAADPSASGIIYVSGLQNLWQLPPGGTWRIIVTPGSSGNVDVAPANGNNVVIAAGTQVFVSTNALAATVGPPTGVTFANITRNLPSRNVARAVFDPVDPTVIYAVLTGFDSGTGQNVFKTTVGASAWTNISPPVDIPCGAIAVDGTTTPTTLYVGTDFGVIRSVERRRVVVRARRHPLPPGAGLRPRVQRQGWRAARRHLRKGRVRVREAGGPGDRARPPGRAGFRRDLPAVREYLTITVYNVGIADLVISNVQVLFGSSDFAVLPTPATPVTVDPGDEITFTVSFTPSVAGVSETAIIRITSNDPAAPFVDVKATGSKGTGQLVTAIADAGAFGSVCLGGFADEPLVLNNSGHCPLSIFAITSTTGEFRRRRW